MAFNFSQIIFTGTPLNSLTFLYKCWRCPGLKVKVKLIWNVQTICFYIYAESQKGWLHADGNGMFRIFILLDLHHKEYYGLLQYYSVELLALDYGILHHLCSSQFCCLLSIWSTDRASNSEPDKMDATVCCFSVYLQWNTDPRGINCHHCDFAYIIQHPPQCVWQ